MEGIMGAWGLGPFENDSACDWVYELEESKDLKVIESAFDAVLHGGFVDLDEGSACVAAADVLAALNGTPDEDEIYPEEIETWVNSANLIISGALLEKANHSLDIVLSENSELNLLWEESDEYEQWKSQILLLKARLNSKLS
jgi:hypothetical protein